MLTKTAFMLGWQDGAKAKRHITRRQAERTLAGWAPDATEAYLNGHDDGVKGDRFRYWLATRGETPAAVLGVFWDD